MKRVSFFVVIVLLLLPSAVAALIEEDWANYTRADTSDDSGNNVTLSWLRKSYTNEKENYTVALKDFDSAGIVVLQVSFKGRSETVILQGEWNADRSKIDLTEPLELFNKTLIITPIKIVPPAGIFFCCPEAEININVLRPKLSLELNEDTRSFNSTYQMVNPFANWSLDPYMSPYDQSISENASITITERPDDSYRMFEEIPVELTVTNEGDSETTVTEAYIDPDGLIFESGKPYYQLGTLFGTEQHNLAGRTGQTVKMKLKFPSLPKKLKYTVHAYVKGIKGGTTYYNDVSKTVTLLPSLGIRKSVTEESMLLSRKDVENIYPAIDSDAISRWLAGGDITVTIGVTNYQNYRIKGIRLTDTLNTQFSTNESLNWTFDLNPLETKDFKYTLKANRPGRFNLPQAWLTYFEFNLPWNLFSNTPSTEVHGPCVQVFKKPDKPVLAMGENATITLTIRNSGDMPSKAKVIDMIPENSTFLGGKMIYEGVLPPKESATISYDISINASGQVLLPVPKVYVNNKENLICGEPVAGKILIKEPPVPTPDRTIIIPEQIPVQTPKSPLQRYGWLEGVIPALMLVLAVAVLFILHRSAK